MTFVFDLASKPGVPNINGVVYSKESFDKMINSEFTQECIKSHTLVVTNVGISKSADNYYRFCATATDCIGIVTSWNDVGVSVEIVNKAIEPIIELLYKENRLELGMNYTCRLEKHKDSTIEAKAMKIHSFSLFDKQTKQFL